MHPSRFSLLLLLGVLAGGFALRPTQGSGPRPGPADDRWKNHPALAEPDGHSHRGDKMVAADIDDPRVLAELARRFKQTEPLRVTRAGVRGDADFERRQEYLLRLLDHYWFAKPRLLGMTWAEVDAVFGPLGPPAGRASVSAGRDTLYLWFAGGRVSGAYYAMGY
jgi:hypothetical protein